MRGFITLLLGVTVAIVGFQRGRCFGSPLPNKFPLGAIGCLFTKWLCNPDEECVDDQLFGTCTRGDHSRPAHIGNLRYTLNQRTLEILQEEIVGLIQTGYTWRDGYTQCILQNILLMYQNEERFDREICAESDIWKQEVDWEIASLLKNLFSYFHGDDEESARYPSKRDDQLKRDEMLKIHKYFAPSQRASKRREYFEPSQRASKRRESSAPGLSQQLEDYLNLLEQESEGDQGLRDYADALDPEELAALQYYLLTLQQDAAEDYGEENYGMDDVGESLSPVEDTHGLSEEYKPDFSSNSGELWSDSPVVKEGEVEMPGSKEEGFPSEVSDDVDYPAGVRPLPDYQSGVSSDLDYPAGVRPLPDYQSEVSSDPDYAEAAELMSQEYPQYIQEQDSAPIESSEELPSDVPDVDNLRPKYAKMLADLLQGDIDPSLLSDSDLDRLTQIVTSLLKRYGDEQTGPADDVSQVDTDLGGYQDFLQDDIYEDSLGPVQEKKSQPDPDLDATLEDEAVADAVKDNQQKASFTVLILSRSIDDAEAAKVISILEASANVPPGTFTIVRNVNGQIIFNVQPNAENLTADSLVGIAENSENEIQGALGVELMQASTVDELSEQIPVVKDEIRTPKYFVLTFVLCGCIAGVLITVIIIYLIKRHGRSKHKLAQLASSGNGVEASQDYQDLCRQRMQSKTSEKPEPMNAAAPRIGSYSENQVNSPSSKSSTSSWSEEPAASNMDISTGHIVLSYMEDHLQNKDRLEKEWESLCAYEADPAGTTVANEMTNSRKNRYPDTLPYDHSRVMLTDTVNISGSDYINATTITDHDPRNPAYIATQGPLPHTVADFWQMVWEQGSVVIVMLTKLTENGSAMCHRYWPEEGSDLYHIYEVHLVSEHIWCDDFLVRSFYLKNLQTNETRTLTQFHFLTWPDNKVPDSVKSLLDFRRKVNKSYRGRSCPIVVHCSDGAGRTGTYTLIDMVLNRLAKGAKEIDIAATLEHIRDQRMGMVKTKEQFDFALASVAEEVHAILKALPQ